MENRRNQVDTLLKPLPIHKGETDTVNKAFYQPKIEEFHVGFEYQYYEYESALYSNSPGGYYNRIFGGGHEDKYFLEHFHQLQSVRGLCRIKKLDKEDIESCGLIVDIIDLGQDTDENELGIYKNEVNLAGSLYGAFFLDSTVHNANIEIFDTFFMIKNKSEFKRLLKQLNII